MADIGQGGGHFADNTSQPCNINDRRIGQGAVRIANVDKRDIRECVDVGEFEIVGGGSDVVGAVNQLEDGGDGLGVGAIGGETEGFGDGLATGSELTIIL